MYKGVYEDVENNGRLGCIYPCSCGIPQQGNAVKTNKVKRMGGYYGYI